MTGPSYEGLARWYDALTRDVPYSALAGLYEKLLSREGRRELTLLDLCCGTGTLTSMLAARGHELIGADRSAEMLGVARGKAEGLDCRVKPMYICQEAARLDLYGTVEGAYCSLDGINYIPPEELPEVFRRLHLFIEPGGKFAFDMHSPEHLRLLGGETFVDEDDGVLCLWRAEFDEEENALFYGMDIFSREKGGLWSRREEEHVEYAHEPERVCLLLRQAGFRGVRMIEGGLQSEAGRLFIVGTNLEH